MPKIPYYAPVLVVALIALGAGYWFIMPARVEVTHLSRGPAVQAVYASGSVEPTVQIDIGPKVSGRLAELMANEHDAVKAGQVLARLDDREIAANVEQLKARVDLAQRENERAQSLLARGTGTVQARDRAESELQAARGALEMATRQRNEYALIAPSDGTIIRRDGEIGELIQVNQTVFSMSCCAPLRITADVDEEDIPLVKPGQKVLIRAEAYPDQHFEGTVDAITPKGDPTARSFRVRIKIPTDTPLMTGMTSEVNIVVGEKQDAMLLPATAVSGGKVWIVREGRLKNLAVATGAIGSAMVEVKSGVDDKDDVVVQPQSWFRPEQRARVKNKS